MPLYVNFFTNSTAEVGLYALLGGGRFRQRFALRSADFDRRARPVADQNLNSRRCEVAAFRPPNLRAESRSGKQEALLDVPR